VELLHRKLQERRTAKDIDDCVSDSISK
jgi:hypothetical protein